MLVVDEKLIANELWPSSASSSTLYRYMYMEYPC